jgi:hypothetical protein
MSSRPSMGALPGAGDAGPAGFGAPRNCRNAVPFRGIHSVPGDGERLRGSRKPLRQKLSGGAVGHREAVRSLCFDFMVRLGSLERQFITPHCYVRWTQSLHFRQAVEPGVGGHDAADAQPSYHRGVQQVPRPQVGVRIGQQHRLFDIDGLERFHPFPQLRKVAEHVPPSGGPDR